jgi:FAD dependent oxidoreductase TIGR03364
MQRKAVIVGAGIIGIAHALAARKAGFDVVILERNPRPLGASVRNFGTLWPIGCAAGSEREQALFGVERWKALGRLAGFPVDACGSLTLAYRDESWEALNQFATRTPDSVLLSAAEVGQEFPAVNPARLKGALRSSGEAVVHPPSAIPALLEHAQHSGISVHLRKTVVKVNAEAVECSDGSVFRFERLLIASGDDLQTLFPGELARANLRRCRLQMMRTQPQPHGFRLGAILVSDLTLCHYPAFQSCASISALQARLDSELAHHRARGIHVIAAQHADGSVTIGDSHEYGEDFEPGIDTDTDRLILEYLSEFCVLQDPAIARRWHGTYLKSTVGCTQVLLHPSQNVTLVTAMGGLGMTLSWGLAEKTILSWVA